MVFQVKLVFEAVKDVVLLNLSVLAIIVDLVAGRGNRPRLFHGVVRLSRGFDRWLRLHRLKGATLREEDGSLLEELIAGAPDADELAEAAGIEFERLVRRRVVERGGSLS